MANVDLNPVRAREIEVVPMPMTISVVSGVESINSKYATVTKVSTGLYKITLKEAYVKLLACTVTLESATAVDVVPQIVSADVSSTKEIQIKLLSATTATDVANCKIHVNLMLKNSSV